MAHKPRQRGVALGALARAEHVADLEEMADHFRDLLFAGAGPSFAERAAQVRAGAAFEVHGWQIKASVPAVKVNERYLVGADDSVSLVDPGGPDDV